MARALEAAAGTIYDIGYRNYEGARLGRGYAFRTLYVHSLRTAFGLRRGGRALIIPWTVFAIICLPAIVTTSVAGMSGGALNNLISYHRYFGIPLMLLLGLFCAAQAPELVSNDQHHKVLPLYFSRALRKHDYALAKLLAMWTAVFILAVTPLLVILAGRLGLPADFGQAVRDESKNFLPILATPVVIALVMGTLSLALASLMSRRGMASALVLGTFLVTMPVSLILIEEAEAGWAALLNPFLTVGGAILAVFNQRPGRGDPLRDANLPPEAFAYGVAGIAILFTLLLLARYRRIAA
jgi:ABC-2 type transport system permease protein